MAVCLIMLVQQNKSFVEGAGGEPVLGGEAPKPPCCEI